jgi:hypothetical protein
VRLDPAMDKPDPEDFDRIERATGERPAALR